MSDHDSRYREFISKLDRDEQRPDALKDIKNMLNEIPNVETNNTVRRVGLVKIFECLNVPNPVEVDLTCEVLQLCFEKLTVGDVVRNYTCNIMFLLRHEKESVRRLAVEEIYKIMTTDPKLLPLPEYIDVFVVIAQLVAERDIAISNKAILITSHLADEAYPKVLEEMKVALDGNGSSKCNAFEVIINISAKSAHLLELSALLGYVDVMLAELRTKDILYQLNIMELLSRLAVTPHGVRYLVDGGVLAQISDFIANIQNDPLGSLLLPGCMKFSGALAHLYAREILENYPAIVDPIFDTILSEVPTLLPVALDTLGFIGTTIEGKLSLAAIGHRFTSTVSKVGELIRNATSEVKVRSLFCMAALIGVENDPSAPKAGPIDHRVTLMTREWFRSLSERPDTMEVLSGVCKNPFTDIKLAGFSLLSAVTQHQWGEELVARTPGLVEYLLDRTAAHTHASKEAKYDVLRRLARSAAFAPPTLLGITRYLEQGPFYTETAMEVAMDEGD